MSPLAALRAFRDRCMLLLHQYVVRRNNGDSPIANPAARHHHGVRRIDSRVHVRRLRAEREQVCTAAVAARIAAAAAPLSRVKAAGRPPARSRFATALRTASTSLAEASHTARARARKTIEQHKRTHPAAGPRHSTRTPGATAEHHDLAKRIKDRLKAELDGYSGRRARGENSIFTNPKEAWT